MPNSRYISYPFVTDARDLMTRAFNYLKSKFTGWIPAEGNLDTWIIEAFADEAADIATLATEVPKGIFRYFGSSIMGIPPIDAAAATVSSTWFFTDDLGHTITAGTQVGIRDQVGILVPFRVLSDVIVAGGETETAPNAVMLIAVFPGAGSSGIGIPGGNVEMIDTIEWVDHIIQANITGGGVDAESDTDYLNRLAVEMRTMSPRPIIPIDFSILARNIAGVQRAYTLDQYNPVDHSFGNDRMVTVFALDSAGQDVSSFTKTKVSDYLESLRELNFVVNTDSPTTYEIDVTADVTILPGYDPVDVHDRVKTAIQDFLAPHLWGIAPTDDPNNPVTWNNDTIVRYLEMAQAVNSVSGVDILLVLQFGLHGGAQLAQDYNMPGIVTLPFANDADVVVNVL